MSSSSRRLALWFAALAVLSIASRAALARGRDSRCALDGTRLRSPYDVELVADGRVLHRFCSLTCAREWPDAPAGASWQVHDEVTGEPLDAERALFVFSSVVTVPARQEHLHAFGHWVDAQAHVDRHSGRIVSNPLAERRAGP